MSKVTKSAKVNRINFFVSATNIKKKKIPRFKLKKKKIPRFKLKKKKARFKLKKGSN